MMKYEQLWERQWQCTVCYSAPPTHHTNFECPACGRIVTKEVSEEFWARNTQEDMTKRAVDFFKRMGGK
jgi:predicted RNA-binding Zn-ribbon protein involved in translation (DUF1610 family)